MSKFLIIQTAFIGDVILATPIIEKIHQFYPDSEIDFLLRKGNEELLFEHPYIGTLHIWDKKGKKYKNLKEVIKKIKSCKYDYVINCQRYSSTGLVTFLSRSKNKIGFSKNPFSLYFTKTIKHDFKKGKHEVSRNLDLIEHLTDNTFVKPKLYPSFKDKEKVRDLILEEYYCIAPASIWKTKQYPIDKWVELIDLMQDKYVYLLGAKSDYKLCEKIKQGTKSKRIINMAGDFNLLQTAEIMKNATMNWVNDSAPVHIASSVNANVTAVFCSTIPEFGFGPLSDNSKTIEVKQNLNCRPCGIHGKKICPEKHFNCAKLIDVNQLVFNK